MPPLVSVFGTPEGKSFNELVRDADEKSVSKRVKQAARYKKWREESVKDGQSMTPEDMHRQRMSLTGGDSLMASYLGDEASDYAFAKRDNEKIAAQVLSEATAKYDEQGKQKKFMLENVNADHDSYEQYSKTMHELNQVTYVEGEINEKIQGLFNTTQMNKEAWFGHRGEKRKKLISEEANKPFFLDNAHNDRDIDNHYKGSGQWFRDGLKSALSMRKTTRTNDAMTKALSEQLSRTIVGLIDMDDGAITLEAKAGLENYFVATGLEIPTGAAWNTAVARTIQIIKNRKKALLSGKLSKNESSFADKWRKNSEIQGILSNDANVTSGYTIQGLQELAVQTASSAGLGPGYFDFTPDGDGMEKIAKLLGPNEFRKLQRIIVQKKNALSRKERAASIGADVENQKTAQQNHSRSIVNGLKDDDKEIWKGGTAAAEAASVLSREYYIPKQVHAQVMTAVADLARSDETISYNQVVNAIVSDKKWQRAGVRRWDIHKNAVVQRGTRHFLLRNNSDPFDQTYKYIASTTDHLKELKQRVTDAPENAYNPRFKAVFDSNGQATGDYTGAWIDPNKFNFEGVIRAWKKTMAEKKDLLDRTFGERSNDVTWNWHDAKGNPRTFTPDDPFWEGGEITSMKKWYEYLSQKIREDTHNGIQELKGMTPGGRPAIDRGAVLPHIGISLGHFDSARAKTHEATGELSALIQNTTPISRHNNDLGLSLEQFFNPATKKLEVPRAWIDGDDKENAGLSEHIKSNKSVIKLAVHVFNLSQDPDSTIYSGAKATDTDRAAMMLRNLVLFNAQTVKAGRDKGKPMPKMTGTNFFRRASSPNALGGKHGAFRRESSKHGQLYKDYVLSKKKHLFEVPWDVFMAGEKNFFYQLLQLGISHAGDDQFQ